MSYEKSTFIEEVKLLLRVTTKDKPFTFNIKGEPAYKYNAAYIKPTKDVDNEGRTVFATLFCDIIFKGLDPQLKVKDRVAVTGNPSLNQYTNRDGKTNLSMVIWVDEYTVTESGSDLRNKPNQQNNNQTASSQALSTDDDGFEEDVPF